MVELIGELAPEGITLKQDSRRNLLFVQGNRERRAAVGDLAATFDVDWFAGMSFALEPLAYSTATDLVPELNKLLSAARGGPLGQFAEIIPNQRLNAILIAAKRPGYIDRIRTWIRRLDVGTEPNQTRLYIHHVQNGRATELAPILQKLFLGNEAADAVTAPGQIQATATTAQPAQEGSLSPESAPSPSLSAALAKNSPKATILADDSRNALLIRTTPVEFRNIKDAIRQLDTAPLQVLIEATIAEVTLDDDLKYGVEYFLSQGNHSGTLSDVASGAVSSNFPGFSYLFSGSSKNKAVINALSSVTDVRVVSSPHLMVQDNRTARLQVGDQVPVATQSSISNTNPTAPTVNNIEFRDTGVVLEVTPRVNQSGAISLEIKQEVSDVIKTTTSGIDSPTIQQRLVSSHVFVQSGQAIILGGLIRDKQTDKESGLPVLSGIPVLGKLFGNTDNSHDRTELLILITPRIVRNEVDTAQVTEEFKRRFRKKTQLPDSLPSADAAPPNDEELPDDGPATD